MIFDKDQTIVRAVQDGQTESYAKLVDRHKDQVYAMLMRLTGDPQAAEELAHETFVRAYQALGNFRGESRFATWLTQIAVNIARDRVRELQRNRFVSLDELLERDADAPVFAESRSHYDPLAEISERDLLKRFEEALQALPANYREIFLLHHMQGISYEDIAGMTGDSVGSLKVRSHRARKILKEILFSQPEGAPSEDAAGKKRV
jgi:RNA polymerase sigma-70 factor (ECF subfamily)